MKPVSIRKLKIAKGQYFSVTFITRFDTKFIVT